MALEGFASKVENLHKEEFSIADESRNRLFHNREAGLSEIELEPKEQTWFTKQQQSERTYTAGDGPRNLPG